MINARLLQLLVEACDDGMVIAEPEGEDCILVYVSPGFERLTGYSAAEVLYQDCRFLQGDDRDQPGRAAIRRALREGRPCRQVLRNYRKDGSLFWNELSITPVYDEADQLTAFIGVLRDISREIEARERLVQLEALLADLRGCEPS